MNTPNHNKLWSEDETILCYYWFCQIPSGKMDKKNPLIIELAELLGRTPSSVVLKMGNLAHFDPESQKRNVVGLKNASKKDKYVVDLFKDNWEDLVVKAALVERKLRSDNGKSVKFEDFVFPEGLDKTTIDKIRINQDFFRNAILSAHRHRCCITGISCEELLIASHIKPWKDSDPKKERTNPANGLCLNALHDKAFDKGLITVLPDLSIRISSKLKSYSRDSNIAFLTQFDRLKIIVPDKFCPDKKFLQYHNDVIFRP